MERVKVLSKIHGTVQIGDTVFQPCTGAIFKVDKPVETGRYAKEASMEEARRILREHEKEVKYGKS